MNLLDLDVQMTHWQTREVTLALPGGPNHC